MPPGRDHHLSTHPTHQPSFDGGATSPHRLHSFRLDWLHSACSRVLTLTGRMSASAQGRLSKLHPRRLDCS